MRHKLVTADSDHDIPSVVIKADHYLKHGETICAEIRLPRMPFKPLKCRWSNLSQVTI